MKILEVKNVTKNYPSFKLDNVSFDIEEGSICGFIGRNGAGKTTTLKGIFGLLHFDGGEVDVFGHNIAVDELENKQLTAFSLSELNYFPDQRIGNLTKVTKRFYKEWDDNIYKKLCEKFNLDQRKRIRELSSGTKVKYSLAVALSHHAKLLIFDEPTSGLDPVSRDEVLDIFKSVVKSKERSILFSTHITSDLEKCSDHIVYIRKGKIVAKAEKDEFCDSYKVVNGPLDKLDSVKDILISYKKEEKTFEGLILKEKIKKIADPLKVSAASLENIMIYSEKEGEENEEFIL